MRKLSIIFVALLGLASFARADGPPSLSGWLQPNGRLTDIQIRPSDATPPAGCTLAPLSSVPSAPGPYAYDAVNQVAIPATLTLDERLAKSVDLRLVGALALKQSPAAWSSLTQNQQGRVQNVIDSGAAAIVSALNQ